ncbi:MAG: hypothetical protein Q8O76_06890 [Chloroflexota bacterium]|nr:hypothetical protein [Chloroflexota bacterium]
MSKKKDREKFELRKRFDPGYQGYRGPTEKPVFKAETKSLVCSRCCRRRNVPPDTPEENFVCLACLS